MIKLVPGNNSCTCLAIFFCHSRNLKGLKSIILIRRDLLKVDSEGKRLTELSENG